MTDKAIVQVSAGVWDALLLTPEGLHGIRQLLEDHKTAASLSERAVAMRSMGQGSFWTEHAFAHVREEIGFRGHRVYLMTPSERSRDVAEWINVDLSPMLPD